MDISIVITQFSDRDGKSGAEMVDDLERRVIADASESNRT